MKKLWASLIALLVLSVVSLADVNSGIQTRWMEKSIAIDSLAHDTTHVIFSMDGMAEQGLLSLTIVTSYTGTFNVWFSSGTAMRTWAAVDTEWTDMVSAFSAEGKVFTANQVCQPVNVTFLQQQALVSTADAYKGFVPACQFFRVSVEPTAFMGDDCQMTILVRFK